MNRLRSSRGDIRSVRKCLSISGSLLPLLLVLGVLAAQPALTRARPSEESYDDLAVSGEYANVDNVEYHRVKVVDGVVEKDHPIVMYKEDFVSEDYDPSKNETSSAELADGVNAHPARRYEDIAERRQRLNRTATEKEHYQRVKPQKMLFDVMPPLPVDDDAASDAAKEAPSKQELSKHPKKYRRRQRRSAEGESVADGTHKVHKRNPYYVHHSGFGANALFFVPQQTHTSSPQSSRYQSHPVPGKLWNSLSLTPVEMPVSFDNRFGGEDNEDRVVWNNIQTATRRPRPLPQTTPRRSPPPLFHDSRPDNTDASFLTTSRPSTGRRTTTRRTPPPLFHDSRPESADTSFFTRAPMTAPRTTAAPAPPSAARPAPPPADVQTNVGSRNPVSQCVWAIVNCCSSRADIRYECFERLGCHGAFWDLNPCADNIRDNVIGFVSEIYD